MELFYVDGISDIVTLSQEESRHCVKVMRHRKNDVIYITDGLGTIYQARIVDDHISGVVVEITGVYKKQELTHELAVAMPVLKKSERFEWFAEKATEIGVTRIIPVITHYTEKQKIKRDRLQRILIAAMKQSLRAYLPQLDEIQTFDQVLELDADNKLIALCDAQETLPEAYKPRRTTLVLIGPEGGFTSEEKQKAINSGFVPVKISNNRLRAETAGVVASALVSSLNLNAKL